MARSKGYRPLWQAMMGKKFESDVAPEVNISVVFGSSDLTLPEPLAQEKSSLPKHAKWIRVPNCAHVIMWNHRETTVELIKETAGI
jgi:pimeloyl-ACP methyl ester carboxylesterase